MAEAEVLFGFWGPKLIEMYPTPQALREGAKRLRWIQVTSAGLDRVARSGLLESDFMVTSASGLHATPIGEYVLLVMLMFCKGAANFTRAQQRKEWVRYMPKELYGKTVGVVGMGHIGTEVARLAKAFGCRVLAIRRSATAPPRDAVADELLPPADLPYLRAGGACRVRWRGASPPTPSSAGFPLKNPSSPPLKMLETVCSSPARPRITGVWE